MMNLFGWMDMANDYEERKVDSYDDGTLFVDTCAVTDGKQPFETAIKHPDYNNDKIVIVEAYNTKEEAQIGHNKWVDIMLNNPPSVLEDCYNAKIGQLIKELGGNLIFERKNNVS